MFCNKNHAHNIYFSKSTARFPSQKNAHCGHTEVALSEIPKAGITVRVRCLGKHCCPNGLGFLYINLNVFKSPPIPHTA